MYFYEKNILIRAMDYVRDGNIQGQLALKKNKKRPCILPSLTYVVHPWINKHRRGNFLALKIQMSNRSSHIRPDAGHYPLNMYLVNN